MEVRFWGVRGSVASSGSHVARIGGNTSCVEVESQGHRLILDAGTGRRRLGDSLLEAPPVNATLLFSHLHWDHVQGFPFFTPAYLPTSRLTLFGPGMDGDCQLRSVLSKQMEPPNFPVPLAAMKATMDFKPAVPNRVINTGPFTITPVELDHPQGCLGFHIEADGVRFVYFTDVEMNLKSLRGEVARVVEGADVLVLDGQYTPDEYEGRQGPPKKGWGHSTMMDAAHVAWATNVGRLFLFHHDPAHNDDTVENMAEEARSVFAATEPAREGTRVRVG